MNSLLNDKIHCVEWGEFKLGDLFEIKNTLSFNKNKLKNGSEFDYVTRTSQNQGVLQKTGFVNQENINPAGVWSLGLLQMDFFYRTNRWYAGQFVRKIIPKFDVNKYSISYFTTILNKQKNTLLSVLVRNVDRVFKDIVVSLPIKHGQIDFEFIEEFIKSLEKDRIAEIDAYLSNAGLKNYELTEDEVKVLDSLTCNTLNWGYFEYGDIFEQIKQGRRLKKDDQIKGDIPFVMSGVTNTGVVNFISNPVAVFPKNSITLDIFGNAFYRGYAFGAGDDTGVYWSEEQKYSTNAMLFFTTSMEKSIAGKFSYGNKLRSSQSLNFKMELLSKDNKPDFDSMEVLVSAIQKLVIKDLVQHVEQKLKVN